MEAPPRVEPPEELLSLSALRTSMRAQKGLRPCPRLVEQTAAERRSRAAAFPRGPADAPEAGTPPPC